MAIAECSLQKGDVAASERPVHLLQPCAPLMDGVGELAVVTNSRAIMLISCSSWSLAMKSDRYTHQGISTEDSSWVRSKASSGSVRYLARSHCTMWWIYALADVSMVVCAIRCPRYLNNGGEAVMVWPAHWIWCFQ